MPPTNNESTPLYKMNPCDRFTDRATDYAKSRPSYPLEAIATILEGLGDPAQLIAADIGAGTGISSRLLAAAGVRVIAIEPNEGMREAATPHPLINFQAGTAEQTHLPDSSVDLVTCFQAFHWFDPTPTLEEFHRILKPGGRLALVWNNRDRRDEFTAAYSQLVRVASNSHPAESRTLSLDATLLSPYFSHLRQSDFPYRQELDLSGLIGRADSTSYLPRTGVARDRLISNLQELYQTRADRSGVCLVYSTSVYLADNQKSV
ncbi:MAG: class I SAM-dependent methyltransferase [Cyanosarcina radialis HA8281-LM2]|jgi:SAM-dependent methyltransferase|nr:class I SAM-dependent methyltransferase [Cyanosarcina radialis HA8281-LM2]